MAYEDNPPENRRWLAVTITSGRIAKGLKVDELAEISGVSESAIRGIERGVTNAKWDSICALSKALDLQIWPTDIKPEPEPETTRTHPGKFEDAINLLSLLQFSSKRTAEGVVFKIDKKIDKLQ